MGICRSKQIVELKNEIQNLNSRIDKLEATLPSIIHNQFLYSQNFIKKKEQNDINKISRLYFDIVLETGRIFYDSKLQKFTLFPDGSGNQEEIDFCNKVLGK